MAVRAAGTLMAAPSGQNRILAVQQPAGVAVLVTPWNFPAAMATRRSGRSRGMLDYLEAKYVAVS